MNYGNLNVAILFWFYKELEVCKNRLEILKKYNPDLKIFGLYGGAHENEELYKSELGTYLDDFYTSPSTDSEWKWFNGDIVLLDWYKKRGINLEDWDSVAVVQWDMLILDSLWNQFPNIKKDEIFISGMRELSKEKEVEWNWTRPENKERKRYKSFLSHIQKMYGYTQRVWSCLFMQQILPRSFFETLLNIDHYDVGFLEYKVPTYIKIFDLPVYEKDVGVCWSGDTREYPMNARPEEIQKEYIEDELTKKDGWRMFHPYFQIW